MTLGRSGTARSARRSAAWRRVPLAGLRARLHFGREDGQGLLEFALIVPILFLVIFGGIEFARAWNNKNDVVHIANEAARYAAVNRLTSANCTKLKNEALNDIPNLQASDVNIALDPSTPAPTGNGQPVAIQVTVPFHTVVPLLSTIMSFSSLKGTATMQFEGSTYSGTCY